jgi:hypothetical protein
VERTSEAIGENIARRQREEMQKAIQLNRLALVSKPIPVLAGEMEAT